MTKVKAQILEQENKKLQCNDKTAKSKKFKISQPEDKLIKIFQKGHGNKPWD